MNETISPKVAAFLKKLKEAFFGATLENLTKNPQSHWDAYKDAFGSVALPIYEKAEGIFLKGNKLGWGDFVTASASWSIKFLGTMVLSILALII